MTREITVSQEWKGGLRGWKEVDLEKKTGLRPSRILWLKLGNVGLQPKNVGKLQKSFRQIFKTRLAI